MAFTETSLADLPKPLRRTYERAREAVEKKNYAYAFQMLRDLLDKAPGCLEIRNTLRQAQIERARDKPGWLVKLRAWPAVLIMAHIRGPLLLKKGKVKEALDLAEKLMILDPTLMPSILFLARAAEEAGLDRLALNVLEYGKKCDAANITLLERQLNIYHRSGDGQNVLRLLQEMCALRPNDLDLANRMKQASASAAMQGGNWNQAESFRDVVKDKEAAQQAVDNERVAIHDEETLARQIQTAEQAVEENPTAGAVRKLADLYRQNKEYEKALEQYNRLAELAGAMDPAIDQAITEVTLAQYDQRIEDWRTVEANEPNRKAEAEKAIEQLQQERGDALFQRIEDRVKRYPNDAQYRFEYGEALYERDRFDEAMKQFQSAQRNPRYRRRCQLGIGQCMAAKGMLEMAMEQFQSTLSETTETDKDRKELLYNLALVHEARDETDEYIKCLKEIYSADANYRDIEERIQAYYAESQ